MTLIDVEDTIVAIATPAAPAPRGAVRLSGKYLSVVLQRIAPEQSFEGATSRRLEIHVDLGAPLGPVPVALMWWPTHRSYTAQPSAELHTFGSLPILTALVRKAITAGARAARPGEFTMRAFLAGRIDLTQAEAVLGVIEAEGRGTLDHALEQLSGNLSKPLEEARSTVLNLLADVEAGLDFVDEDIEFIDRATLRSRLTAIQQLLRQTMQTMRHRGGGADRPMVVLRGLPNAGKSCLFNRLSDQDAAIVSDVAGTTRDAVMCEAKVGGKEVTLSDTAGLETIDTEISEQSQVQGNRVAQLARVRLWCVDASRADFQEASLRMSRIASSQKKSAVVDLFLATKIDQANHPIPEPWIGCSAVTGQGIEIVARRIGQGLDEADEHEIGSVVGTAARCGHSLQLAADAADAAMQLIELDEGQEFIATELRAIAQQLGEVTGAVYTDDILDRVFSRFCIGK